MSAWRVEVKPNAQKQYLRVDGTLRRQIKDTLRKLEGSESPLLHPKVRGLTGNLKGDFRMRIGPWRILFTPDPDTHTLHVYSILPRGGAY